jgi:ketosteroid isomerase-like protein
VWPLFRMRAGGAWGAQGHGSPTAPWDPTEIRALLEAWTAAVRCHDMPAILALRAPDIVTFDLPPPLQAKGLEDYKRTWDSIFQYHKVSQAFDIEELGIVADDDVGFAAPTA